MLNDREVLWFELARVFAFLNAARRPEQRTAV